MKKRDEAEEPGPALFSHAAVRAVACEEADAWPVCVEKVAGLLALEVCRARFHVQTLRDHLPALKAPRA